MKTFRELAKDKVGTIYHDEFKDGMRFIILRGPPSLCAYIGIPLEHPLAGQDYDDLPIDCHGGLTFSGSGNDDVYRPEGFWWYGWDYGHAGDKCFYDLDFDLGTSRSGDTGWLVEDIIKDSWSAKYDMEHLIKLAEGIRERCNER